MRNRDNIKKFIDYINESRIQEAKQAIYKVVFSSNEYKYGEIICNTRDYNKLKSRLKGFKEIDSNVIEYDKVPTIYYYELDEKIKKYGLDPTGFSPNEDGVVFGKSGSIGYGYAIYKMSDIKVK